MKCLQKPEKDIGSPGETGNNPQVEVEGISLAGRKGMSTDAEK